MPCILPHSWTWQKHGIRSIHSNFSVHATCERSSQMSHVSKPYRSDGVTREGSNDIGEALGVTPDVRVEVKSERADSKEGYWQGLDQYWSLIANLLCKAWWQ